MRGPGSQPGLRRFQRSNGLTLEGTVQGCRILKGLPHMDEAVLQALHSRRYRPVMYQGKPVTVSYTFNMKLAAP